MKTKSILLTALVCISSGLCFVSCCDDHENAVIPVQVVTGLSFADTDPEEGKIGGTLTWNAPASADNITKYMIYLSPDGKVKESGLGEVNAGTNSFLIPSGTGLAAYIIVAAANPAGESKTFASLKLIDAINEPTPPVSGYYILNSGKMNSNNASLYFYNNETGEIAADVFKTKNGRGLGDTANDMIVYGSKMYIAVNVSGTIEVTDLKGKSMKQITSSGSGKPLQPRYLASHNGQVYVSLSDGYVARIDTASLEIDAKVEVGRNPEQMAVSADNLYVANSGGFGLYTETGADKTVSVIDLNDFTETKKIEVEINPCRIIAGSNGDLYVISMGDYGAIPNKLQRIDKDTDEVSVIGNATEMALLDDVIYLFYSQYDANWNQTITYHKYDTRKGEMTDNFIAGGVITQPLGIFTNAADNSVMISESDYVNNGDVYIFTAGGELVNKVEAGLNPAKAVKVSYYE